MLKNNLEKKILLTYIKLRLIGQQKKTKFVFDNNNQEHEKKLEASWLDGFSIEC
jgi:hypothetical protein